MWKKVARNWARVHQTKQTRKLERVYARKVARIRHLCMQEK